jgi:hypothetical protein
MADSIFDAMYTESMTDEQVIKLGISSYTLQESMPSNRLLLEKKFMKYINKRALRSLV